MKKAIKAIFFLIICFVSLTFISKVLTFEHEMEPGRTMKEFYGLKDHEVQMFILGSSHTELSVSPMELYKNNQITSYNFSTAKQPIELSYYLLKEGLKTQSPKVVIYDVANLFYKKSDVNIARFRYVMDSMPLSMNKLELAGCYADYNSNLKIFSIAEALCPIYYYHDRWKNLDENDFKKVNEPMVNLKGQFMRTYINEIKYNPEKIDAKAAKKIEENPESIPKISENNMDYFLKMKKLCDDNDIKLLMITTPTVRWNSIKAGVIDELCKEKGLDFVDLNMPDGELLNYSADMADGNHVTAYGAKKVTKYLADYIVKNYGIKGQACTDYDDSVKYYDAYDNVLKYQMETDFSAYLSMLNENKKDLAVFVCAKDDIVSGLQKQDIELLQKLGCKQTFDKSNTGNSYITVIDAGELKYEAFKKEAMSYDYILENDNKVQLISKGRDAGNLAVINIDGKNYSINSTGLNIVVYDKQSKTVLDSVAFNTNSEDIQWYRGTGKNLEKFMFKSYRDWVLENY